MPDISDKIRQSKEAGYSDVQIADFLSQNGYGDQIEQSRSAGYSYDDIVRHLSGEKRGVGERLKQGMADFYLSTKQMGEYVGDKVGLGDVEISTEGVRYITPEEVKSRRVITQDAIAELERQKGDAGIGAEIVTAAGNPMTWMGGAAMGAPIKEATKRQALAQSAKAGAIGAGAYELGLAQEGEEFDPIEKMEDVATSATIGAVAVPGIEEGVKLAKKIAPTGIIARKAGDIARGVVAPFGAGARRRAEDRIKGLVPDAEVAASRLDEVPIADALSPAQRTGEPGLLGMEETIARSSPKAEKMLADQKGLARQQLDEAASGVGEGVSAQKTSGFIEQRRENLINRLNQDAQEAQQRAAERVAQLTPERRPSEASVIVRDELENAMRGARVTEKALWESVPKAGLGTQGVRNRYLEIVKNTPKAQADDIPEAARKFLDPKSKTKFKSLESSKELYGLRSELLKEARNARAGDTPNFNKARIADELADSLLDDLGAQVGNVSGKVGKPLREALDYSRQFNQTYGQGSVGKILGSQRTGAERIAPEMTLEATVGAGKTKGSVAINEMVQAAGTSPQLRAGISDYISNQFNKVAVKDGVLNPTAARKFIKENADVLDNFPEMRAGIDDSVSFAESAAMKQSRADRIGKSLYSKQQSKAAEFLGAPVEKEFERIVKAQNPAVAAREISKMAAKDKSGEASLGLKTSVQEYLMSGANGSGEKLATLLGDKRIGPAVKEILSPDEIKMFDKISKELSSLEGKNAKEVKAIMEDLPSKLIEYPIRVMAARSGAKLGAGTSGAALLTAGMASQNAKNLINKMHQHGGAEKFIIEAMNDKDLMKILLTETTTPAERKIVEKQLDGWISNNRGKIRVMTSGPGAQIIQDDDEEEEPQGFKDGGHVNLTAEFLARTRKSA